MTKITNEIASDIETLVAFFLDREADKDVKKLIESAQRVEAWLATYPTERE